METGGKMKNIKKILMLILCAAMLLSLAACGGKEQGEGSSEKKEPGGSKEQTEVKDEYVYAAEFTPLKHQFSGGIYNLFGGDDGCFYTSSYEMIADNTPEGVVPEWEGQYWEYGEVLYRIQADGSVEKISYTPTPAPEGMEGGGNIQSMKVLKNGNICVLECVYAYSTDGMPEDVELYSDEYWNLYEQYYRSSEDYFIRVLSPDGSELSRIELKGLTEGLDYFYPYGFVGDDEGNFYIACDTVLMVVNSEGEKRFDIQAENWIDNVYRLNDGRIVCSNYGEDGYRLSVVDLAGKSFGENLKMPANAYNILIGGGDYDIYYNNGINFFGYSFETGEAAKILNWISCDVDPDGVYNNVVITDQGEIVSVSSTYNRQTESYTNELITLTKKLSSTLPQKTHITLATQYLNYDVRSKIIEFNKTNEKYRIEVLDYSEYNTEEDYSAGLTKLTTELLAGNMPDIIDLNGVPAKQLAAKGMLIDLYPLIDSDSEFDRDDFFPSVLNAMESNGKLYTTVAGFTINTVIGAAGVVGDTPGWTVDEFKAALASMPEGCTAFNEYTTRSDILNTCLYLDMDNFVNWETGECNFNSEGFIKLLEFANSFPSEFDWEHYEWTEESDETARIAAGKQMLASAYIYDFDYSKMYKAVFGGDITYIGYPTEFGTGNMLEVSNGYALTSKCTNVEGAWEFLRMFFTEDYQLATYYGFPVNKNAFNERLEEAMTPMWKTDENGNYVLDENGNRIEESRGGWGWGDIMIEMYALTQEEADEVLDLINSTTKVANYDESISSIVLELCEAYFSGQKSAAETAKLVQSKVNIYVNEQR